MPKVRMLTTQTGGVNNGFGNLTMTYEAGVTYTSAPAEDVEHWLSHGFAEIVPDETPVPVYAIQTVTKPETFDVKPSDTKVDKALDELKPKHGKRRR